MPQDHLVDQPASGVLHAVAGTGATTRAGVMTGTRRSRRRQRVLALAVVVLVLFGGGLAAALTLRHLDHEYGPIQGGAFGGLYATRGFEVSNDGFSYHLSEAPNATGQLIASLENLGAHSVKVTSIEPGQIATKIQWSVFRTVPGGSVYGVDTPWRTFPAIIPARGTIRLLITIHHPSNCGAYPKIGGVSTARYVAWHRVHWESLLHDHRTWIKIWDDRGDGIPVC